MLSWGSRGAGRKGTFDPPIGPRDQGGENLYVTDVRNRRVQWFDTQGKFLGSIHRQKGRGGQASRNSMRPARYAYYRSSAPRQVSVYTQAGELVRNGGKNGTVPEGEFNNPGGIAIAKDGSIYVADQTNRTGSEV
jgi:DNA-binding beta-propeller fold protein YncE